MLYVIFRMPGFTSQNLILSVKLFLPSPPPPKNRKWGEGRKEGGNG
jgi:hypothetical protein